MIDKLIDKLIEMLNINIEIELENGINGRWNTANDIYVSTLREVVRIAEGIKKKHEATVNISLENVDYPDEPGWYLCHIDAPFGMYKQTDTEIEDSFQAVYVIDGYVNIAGFENGTLLRDFIDDLSPLRWIRVINDLFPKTTNNLPSEHGYYFVYQNGLEENGRMVLFNPHTKTYQTFGSEQVFSAEPLIECVWEKWEKHNV